MAPMEIVLPNGPPSPRTKRSQSISSDRPSSTGYGGLLSPPVTISPDAVFIAPSAASQIVTNDHDSQADSWLDQHGIEPSGETAMVAPPALKLVNRFLDQLLFNFLSTARSTTLQSLRPAVSEVLKPKLAKEAINGADQELNEYLGGGEDEELEAFHSTLQKGNDWDLELVWKRTRLRCMVYSSLGDMEEEDEDYYTEQEHLDGPPGSTNRFSNNPGVVSPAVAIFLTSILEFMGEQVLIIAGQAAYHRLRQRHEKEEREGATSPAEIADRVVVEEADMERVALDRTIGRLWRGWKKRIRSPTTSISMVRSFSRDSIHSRPGTSGKASVAAVDEPFDEDMVMPSMATVLNIDDHAAAIPLPMGEDDIREIEIPGVAQVIFDGDKTESESNEEEKTVKRAKSLKFFHNTSETVVRSPKVLAIPVSRKRRNSEPSRGPLPYMSQISKRTKTSDESEEEDSLDDVEMAEESAKVTENEEKEPIEKFKEALKSPKGLLAGVVAGAAAIGATAVAGVIAAAQGQAPQTSLVDTEAEDSAEEFEEPKIMTSHRISVGGRISPDDTNQPSRRSSGRTPSVHSVKLIDVASTRSRSSTVNTPDFSSTPIVSSRPNSFHAPTLMDLQTGRVGSPVSRGPNASPVTRVGSGLSMRHARTSTEQSISESEEKAGGEAGRKHLASNGVRQLETVEDRSGPSSPISAASFAGAMQGIDVGKPTEQRPVTAEKQATPLGSTFLLDSPPKPRKQKAPAPPPPTEPSQPVSKVTILSRTADDNGAPPLTPLREMMEGAPDTSDESSVRTNSPQARRGSDQKSSRAVNGTRSSSGRSSKDENKARAIHTSGSGSSGTSHKLKPVRTSEESANSNGNKGQSFEQLIRSDQTIQYTLTPQNMRDIEGPESPRSPRMDRPPTGRSHSSSLGKASGLTRLQSNPQVELPQAKPVKAFKPVPRPSSNTGSRLRPNAPQPRDARVDRDSIGDFAEFIRSTGPATSYEPPPPRSAATQRSMTGMRNVSGPTSRVAPPIAAQPKRTNSSASRARLQARDAAVSRGDSISDLIDFVRSGPQLEKDHRIPRSVAPFRTTMDSDQMSGAAGGKAIDATFSERYSNATPSITSSFTSQTPLVNGSTTKSKPPPQSHNNFDDEDRMPKRKTRRVRDPYAIDLSDEEDEYTPAPSSRPKAIEEESLADFLKNVPPPKDSSPPVLLVNPAALKKKNSSPGLMSRFGRNGIPSPTNAPSKSISTKPISSPSAPVRQTANGFEPLATPKSPPPTLAPQVLPPQRKVVMKSYQPREAAFAGRSGTNDLAAFLMSSEPPSAAMTQPKTFVPAQKEEKGFGRMFGRKKN